MRLEGKIAIVIDVSVEADCKVLIDRVIERHGRVDVLHNNVGIGTSDGDTTAIGLDNWRTTFDVNVGGAMLPIDGGMHTRQG
ncbi:MAG: NAD(P)-dependent dehydrogenase (short-subunit alcohol dehydrogenase family) [Candidatus Poriferisodalaceae bacterium]|jgi:NAD(P)-dependent dehydrogenase (short-subunit alcohol dehydrogenase family)